MDFAEHTWNENQHVYSSLFGKHQLDDIKKQIVLKVYDANKVANCIDKNPIIGKIIETKWGVDASIVANTFTKETFEGAVLCFDDFERISPNLSITEVLGFISESKEYLQTCFDFTRWVKGFAGNRPFEATYENILEALKELAGDDKYKNKLELMIDFFGREG